MFFIQLLKAMAVLVNNVEQQFQQIYMGLFLFLVNSLSIPLTLLKAHLQCSQKHDQGHDFAVLLESYLFKAGLYHIEKQALETWSPWGHFLAICEVIPVPFPASHTLFLLRERKLLNGNRRIEGPLGYFSQNSEFVRNSHSVSRKKITDNP